MPLYLSHALCLGQFWNGGAGEFHFTFCHIRPLAQTPQNSAPTTRSTSHHLRAPLHLVVSDHLLKGITSLKSLHPPIASKTGCENLIWKHGWWLDAEKRKRGDRAGGRGYTYSAKCYHCERWVEELKRPFSTQQMSPTAAKHTHKLSNTDHGN